MLPTPNFVVGKLSALTFFAVSGKANELTVNAKLSATEIPFLKFPFIFSSWIICIAPALWSAAIRRKHLLKMNFVHFVSSWINIYISNLIKKRFYI